MQRAGDSGEGPTLGQLVHRWAREFSARDLIMIGVVSVLFGLVLLLGPAGGLGFVNLIGNVILTSGILALLFGIPWFVVGWFLR